MRSVRIYGSASKIKRLVGMSRKALRDGAYRVANRLHAIALNMQGRSAPQIAQLLNVHRSKVSIWLHNYQKHGVEGLLEGHRSGRPTEMSDQDRQRLSDILDSGPVAYGFASGVWTSPWLPELLKMSFPSFTTLLMCRVFSMQLGSCSRFSVQERHWLKLTRLHKSAGQGISIQT